MATERTMQRCIERKMFSSDFIFRLDQLQQFFDAMDGYTGPFSKSMFLNHSTIIEQCKNIGIKVHRSKINKGYYIATPQTPKVVIFDESLLDLET